MTTIKLKDTPKKDLTIYKVGQWFKDEEGVLFILSRPDPSRLALVGVEQKDSYHFRAYKSLVDSFAPEDATLDKMFALYNINFTPISVTISED